MSRSASDGHGSTRRVNKVWHLFLRPIVKPMRTGAFSFLEQLCLSRQPMLDIVAWQRTLVHISEVCLSGYFIR